MTARCARCISHLAAALVLTSVLALLPAAYPELWYSGALPLPPGTAAWQLQIQDGRGVNERVYAINSAGTAISRLGSPPEVVDGFRVHTVTMALQDVPDATWASRSCHEPSWTLAIFVLRRDDSKLSRLSCYTSRTPAALARLVKVTMGAV
jgi:hypothetical protein